MKKKITEYNENMNPIKSNIFETITSEHENIPDPVR